MVVDFLAPSEQQKYLSCCMVQLFIIRDPPTYGSEACHMQILTPTWQKFLRLVAGFFLSRDLAFVRKLCITRRSGSNPCNTRLFLLFRSLWQVRAIAWALGRQQKPGSSFGPEPDRYITNAAAGTRDVFVIDQWQSSGSGYFDKNFDIVAHPATDPI